MSAKIRQKSPPENVTRPGQSMRPPDGACDSSTLASVSAIAPIPIGTLMKKMNSQPNPSVSAPPTSGPIATAAPVVAPQSPNAVPRSAPWKALASSASEVANISAPPTPCTARARLSASGLSARPQASEAMVKTTRPATKISRRPNRSASEPPVSSSAASESA